MRSGFLPCGCFPEQCSAPAVRVPPAVPRCWGGPREGRGGARRSGTGAAAAAASLKVKGKIPRGRLRSRAGRRGLRGARLGHLKALTSGEAQRCGWAGLGPEAELAASLRSKERVKSGESYCENTARARAGEPVLRGGSRFSELLKFHLLLSGTAVRTFPFGVGLKNVGS